MRVIEAMQRMKVPSNVELVDGGTAGLDLLDVVADRRKVIVIDAVQADKRMIGIKIRTRLLHR